MKFHTPSFLIGFGSAAVIGLTGKRLKPVAVELGALGLHLVHLGRGVVERQREHVEDLWAEIEERNRERKQALAGRRNVPVTQSVGNKTSASSNGTEAHR